MGFTGPDREELIQKEAHQLEKKSWENDLSVGMIFVAAMKDDMMEWLTEWVRKWVSDWMSA